MVKAMALKGLRRLEAGAASPMQRRLTAAPHNGRMPSLLPRPMRPPRRPRPSLTDGRLAATGLAAVAPVRSWAASVSSVARDARAALAAGAALAVLAIAWPGGAAAASAAAGSQAASGAQPAARPGSETQKTRSRAPAQSAPQPTPKPAATPSPAPRTAAGPHPAPASAPPQPASTQTAAAFCTQAVKRLPNLGMALCAPGRLVDSGGRSVQGQPLWQRDIVAPKAKRRVLVIGGVHGDELSSGSLAFHWMSWAEQTPSDVHWRFVPVLNPDGTLRDKPTRTNANGVDLNRNFPTPDWDKEAPLYWAKRTRRDPRRYPGPKALSEPETRWLMAEMERWKPDLIVAIHAPYGVLDFDGPAVPPQRLGRLYLDQVGIFPGSLGNWGGVHKKVPVVTIELNHALRTPQDAEMRQMWLDLLRWIGERLGAS